MKKNTLLSAEKSLKNYFKNLTYLNSFPKKVDFHAMCKQLIG